MNRNFFLLGIYFFGLAIACGLLQSLIHFQIGGAQMYYLQPFAGWYLVGNIISLMGTLFLLKYFHYKKYWVSFSAGVIAAILSFCLVIFTYITIIFVARELFIQSILINLLSISAGIVFALSLILSQAGKDPWLKTAGVVMLINNLVLGSALIWGMIFREFLMYGTYDKVLRWILLSNNLIPVFFIINYWNELRSLKMEEENEVRQGFPAGLFRLAGAIALMATLIFGLELYRQSRWSLDGLKKGPEKAQALAKAFEARTYVGSKGDTLRYLFMKPLDYDPEKKYPLVVCLHGGTWGLPPDAVRHVEVPEPSVILSNPENRKKYPAFLFMPQCPPGASWGGVPGFPAADSLIFETIAALEEEFSIDEKRRYVAGGSGGGRGSWHFIGTRPEMFAAAIPFCGAGNPALAPKMVDVPVWAFHGSVDRNVPVSGSREMIEAIRKAGGKPRYTEFPGVGHNVWPEISKTPGLLEWLFTQKRD